MSKHNKKNTLSFVILSLLTATPALTSAGGWLGGFRILAHLTAGLGFNIGKTKIKRNNLYISDALRKSFSEPSSDYFSAISNAINDWSEDLNNSELAQLAKDEKADVEKYLSEDSSSLLEKLVESKDEFDKIRERRNAIIKEFYYEKSNGMDGKIQEPPKLPEAAVSVDESTNNQGAMIGSLLDRSGGGDNPASGDLNKIKDNLSWSSKFLEDIGADRSISDGKGGEIQLGDEPVFPASGDYDCNVPSFWRRLEFSGEVSALFQALDWLGVGLHGGLTGSLHQAELNDISRIRDSVSFSIKFGGAVQITKWFQCAVMAAAERHSFKRDALDMTSTDSSDSVKKEIDNYNAINRCLNTLKTQSESLDDDISKKVKGAISQQQAYLQKEFLDSFEFSGWSWGIKIQPAFFLWLNEMIALKVGVEFTLPISEIKQFTPAPRAAVLFGVVISII